MSLFTLLLVTNKSQRSSSKSQRKGKPLGHIALAEIKEIRDKVPLTIFAPLLGNSVYLFVFTTAISEGEIFLKRWLQSPSAIFHFVTRVYYPIWNSKKIPYYKICEVVLHFMIWPPCQRRRITFQIGFCCVAKRPKELVLHIKLFYIYCVSTVKFDLIPRIRSHNMWNLLDFCKLSIEAYYL